MQQDQNRPAPANAQEWLSLQGTEVFARSNWHMTKRFLLVRDLLCSRINPLQFLMRKLLAHSRRNAPEWRLLCCAVDETHRVALHAAQTAP